MPCSFLCSESNCDHVVQYGIHFDRLQWAGWSSANDTNSGYSVLVCLSLYFVFFILGECQFCCLKMRPTQHKEFLETGRYSTTFSESVQMYVNLVLARMKLFLDNIMTTVSGKYMLKKCDLLNL